MTGGITVCCWLRAESDDIGRFFRHRWSGRPSGYWLSLENGRLSGTIACGARESNPLREIGAAYPGDGGWHHIALTYRPAAASLFIDGERVAEIDLERPMSPAYGGLALVEATTAAFDLDELRWAPRALSREEVAQEMQSPKPMYATLKAYDFSSRQYDFGSRVQTGDPGELDRQHLLRWAEWCRARGLWLNHIAVPRDEDMNKLNRLFFQPLRERGLLSRAYMRLPYDEASSGPRAETNRRWAAELNAVAPEVLRHQTLGGMGGSRSTQERRIQALHDYVGLVDIWSMRSHVFERHKDFFSARVSHGDCLSIYIHDANWIGGPTVLLAGRNFFWYLFRHDLNMVTLWNVNLWYQPEKDSRPERRLWETSDGFWTLKRNPSGIACGMLFYPGEEGPLNSLRTEAWRDGIEDYEYFVLLRDELARARDRGLAGDVVTAAETIMAELKDWESTNRAWRARPTTDTSRIQTMRIRVAEAIEALRREPH
jgi:hypothetical protein